MTPASVDPLSVLAFPVLDERVKPRRNQVGSILPDLTSSGWVLCLSLFDKPSPDFDSFPFLCAFSPDSSSEAYFRGILPSVGKPMGELASPYPQPQADPRRSFLSARMYSADFSSDDVPHRFLSADTSFSELISGWTFLSSSSPDSAVRTYRRFLRSAAERELLSLSQPRLSSETRRSRI